MAESIKSRINALGVKLASINLKLLFDSVRTELSAFRTLTTELRTDHATFKTAVDQTETLVEELHDDHATFKTLVDELKTDYTALLADVTEIRTKLIDTHVKLDADAGVTDTNYAATNNPAALTATAILASSPATLTAAKPASAPATITAAAVSESLGE